ncbi:hypothetical protein D9Q98_000169 [Chlorella vulgaris]|uniref:protein-serine/threonine phosphatase n=1 Tax=Chlorella vulgaris TaxID=3077 RepID=A0A9D4TXQ1_CHLVU|nr:hypothetical protein D9Q98_000169 [Chlorella vulgaris]
MTAQDDHKVRGGSALSIALGKVSPPASGLHKSSPVDSACSASSHRTLGWLSSSAGSQLASLSPSPAGDALAHASSAPEVRNKQRHQQQQQQQQQHKPQQHRRIPFLSCFGASGTEHDSDECQQVAISSSEVGIRPCFYWLESPAVNEEDRLVAEANARWLKSDCQDDAVVMERFGGQQHQLFAGVFDGHGPYGRNAAKFASTRLPQLLAAKLATARSERKRLAALRSAFLEVNASMREEQAAGFDASLSGTTACCALLVGRRVLVASSGDSRCLVARRDPSTGELEVLPLTWDAKPSQPDEHSRIVQSGGVVKQLLDEQGHRVGAYRVFRRGDDVLPGLAMSRSLGDLYAHSVGVSAEPILNTYTLGERDLFLILATDGLWDIMDNEEAADFVERYKGRRDAHVSCAEALTLEAQERWKALHEEAIVDDISCVILHTAGLPPAECQNSLPRPLARAASCNDEANELYVQWKVERERNPSNHKPQQYFKRLYGGEEGEQAAEQQAAGESAPAADVEASTTAPPCRVMQRPVTQPQPVAAAVSGRAAEEEAHSGGTPPSAGSCEGPLPPLSPFLGDPPQYTRTLQRSGSSSVSASSAAAAVASAGAVLPLRLPSCDVELSCLGGVLLPASDDFHLHSPHSSSYGDVGSENSEPSIRRGGAFSSTAWGELHRHSITVPQAIPLLQRQGSCDDGANAMSLPLEAMLRPVRKAYPSSSNMQYGQGCASYRGDASADTPRDSCDMERKVRGGMSRSLSHHRLHSTHASVSSLQSHSHSYAPSGMLSCRASSDLFGHGRRSHQEDRVLGSAMSSPSGESLLGLALSPQASPGPVASPYTRVHTPGTVAAALQYGRTVPPPPGLIADMVQRGARLGRTITDTAGLVEAALAVSEAGGCASGCSPAAVPGRRPPLESVCPPKD